MTKIKDFNGTVVILYLIKISSFDVEFCIEKPLRTFNLIFGF